MGKIRFRISGLLWLLISACMVASADIKKDSSFDSFYKLPTEDLARIGEEAYRSGDYERAIEAFAILRPRYEASYSEDLQKLFARSFIFQGCSLYEQGAYTLAMEAHLRARRIAETHNWQDLLAESLAGIGNIYASNYDYETATTFYRHALEIVEPMPADSLKKLRASVLNNLTGTYSMRQMVDSARIFSRRFELLGNVPEHRHVYDVQLTKALVEDAASNHRAARILYRRTVEIADSLVLEPIYAAAVYSCMAGSYEKTGSIDSALYYMHIAADVALQEGYMTEHIATLRDLARLYDKRGDYNTSMRYKSRYLELADSLRVSEERDKLHSSQMLYALDTNATTIRGLNAIRTLQWRWLIALTSALLIVIILLFILYRQKHALSQAWNSLYEQNLRQIEDENSFRTTIQRLESKLAEAESHNDNPESAPEIESNDIQENNGQNDSRTLVLNDHFKDVLAQKIKNVMEKTDLFCQPDFSLEKLASEVGSNARYVSEVVNDNLGVSFRTMLNDYRIKRAMMMLSDPENYGHLTIKAIGESVGYKSSSTFITVFTRHTGLKPSLYHKLALEKIQKN